MDTTLKSTGAILAGFVTIALLTVGFDIALEKTGVMKTANFDFNPWYIIAIAIIVRAIFLVGGCYLTARLAPNRPMLHTIILGILGVLLNISGTVMMWNSTPHWFSLLMNILPLPCAWLGGKLKVINK